MQPLFIQNHLDIKTASIGAVVLVAVIAIGFLALALRRRRARRELEELELIAGERRNRFFAAADSLPFSSDPGETAHAIASLFKDYLSIRVLALFAGPEGGKQLENLLLRQQDLDERGALLPRLLPTLIPSETLDSYIHPQFVPLGQFALGPEAAHHPTGDSADSDTAESEHASEADVDLDNTLASKSRQSAAASIHRSDSVAVLPWKGSFGWHGLIVAGSEGQMDPDDLSVVYEFQVPISSRLSCALELDQRVGVIADAKEQQSRTLRFVRSLPSLVPVESHLSQVLHGVSELLEADSAALWRVDSQTRTLNMAAADGLNATDFLPVPIGRGFCGDVVENAKVLAIEDALADPRCLFPEQYREAGIGSYLGVPVFNGNDVVGVLEVHTERPRKYDEGNSAALKIAAASIQARSSRGSTGALGLRAETAYIALSEALQGLGSRKELLEAAVEVVGHAVGASRTLILQPEEAPEGPAAYLARYEYCAESVAPALNLRFAADPLKRVIALDADSKPVVIDDTSTESLMTPQMAADLEVLSEVAAPIKAGNGLPWLLWVHRCEDPRVWNRDEIAFVERVAHQIAIARSNIEALEKASSEVQSARSEMESAVRAARLANRFIEALPEALVELDPEGRIASFNSLSRVSLGLGDDDVGRAAETAHGLTMSDDSVWARVNACQSVIRFETFLARPLRAAGAAATALDSGHASNGKRPIVLSVSPVRGDEGQIVGRLIVIEPRLESSPDVAEQSKAREAALNARIAQLEGSLAEARAVQQKLSASVEAGEQSKAREAALTAKVTELERSLAEARTLSQNLSASVEAGEQSKAREAALNSKVTELERSLAEARAQLSAAVEVTEQSKSREAALGAKVTELEAFLAEVRGLSQKLSAALEAEEQTRAREEALAARVAGLEASLTQAQTLAQKLSGAVENGELVPSAQYQILSDDHERATKAAQQLLEVNRLKSEFIVNAGRELDASLQSMLGQTELLGDGEFGPLTTEQAEAVKAVYAWGRRLKSDVDWLIDYGSARSRRLDVPEEDHK